MSERRRCGMPILPPLKGTTPLWQGHCQNAPMIGYDHCRHHLTSNERAQRFALGMGITTEQALERLKAVGWRADD